MVNTIQILTEFIGAAKKSRIYPDNTAYAFKAALRLFEPELTDEERESFDTFKNHFEQIYRSVHSKNQAKFTASSLAVYRRRLLSLISDYEKYGVDPTKMASWDRPSRKITGRKMGDDGRPVSEEQPSLDMMGTQIIEKGPTMDRFELSLRPNVKAIILVPSDLSGEEVKKIKGLIDYLANNAK